VKEKKGWRKNPSSGQKQVKPTEPKGRAKSAQNRPMFENRCLPQIRRTELATVPPTDVATVNRDGTDKHRSHPRKTSRGERPVGAPREKKCKGDLRRMACLARLVGARGLFPARLPGRTECQSGVDPENASRKQVRLSRRVRGAKRRRPTVPASLCGFPFLYDEGDPSASHIGPMICSSENQRTRTPSFSSAISAKHRAK